MFRPFFVTTLAAVFASVGFPQAAEFEVASVKPNVSGSRSSNFRPLPGGRLVGDNVALATFIRVAYNVRTFQISGAPGSLETERYDISAKAEKNATMEEMRPMLQTLLASRFQLRVRREMRESPVYELVAAKGGLKVTPSKDGTCLPPDPNRVIPPPKPGDPILHICGGAVIETGRIDGFRRTMPLLAGDLTGILGRIVVDKTGYAEAFDVHLEFTPDDRLANTPDPTAPSIFAALQEQLGLRLEPSKAPVEILVIDHVEKAAEN